MRPIAASTPSARGTSAAPSGGNVGSSRARRAARSSTARARGSSGSPLLASSSERSASRTSRAALESPAAAPSAGSRLRSSHSAKPGAVVEQVGAVLAIDGVDERLHDPQRPGRGLAAAGVHEAGQQRFAFHAPSLAEGIRRGSGRLGERGEMTEPIEHLPPEDEADLAALADGSLYGPRRAALEARLRRRARAGRRAGAPARRGGEADRAPPRPRR